MEEVSTNEFKQYIVVKLANEQYGIDIQYVDNIVRMQKVTRVPKSQDYFKGVINLRGEIIPVMSLRLRFDMEEDNSEPKKMRILILKLESSACVGIIVDEVREVVTLETETIEKVQHDAGDEKSIFLSGIGKHDNNLISILNIQSVIVDKEKEKEA